VPSSAIGVATRCGFIHERSELIASLISTSDGNSSVRSTSVADLRKSLAIAARIAGSRATIAARSRSSFSIRSAAVARLAWG